MAFTVVPDKASGDILTEANWDTHIKDNMNSGVPVVLANSTLAGATSPITLSSISQSWAHLMLVCYLRETAASANAQVSIRFNADSGANYDTQRLQGSAAAASAFEAFAGTEINAGTMPGASGGANLFAAFVVNIPHYSQATNNKSLSISCGHKEGTATTNMRAQATAAFWRSNAAITEISLYAGVTSFAIGSRVTLYGLP